MQSREPLNFAAAMMVYLYLFKSSWRDAADQALSYSALKKKYKWDANTWKKDKDVLNNSLDSSSMAPGVSNPDNYFPPEQVLASIACWK